MLRMRTTHVAMSVLSPKGNRSVNPTAPIPRPKRDPASTLAGKWRVLAQLPDVADDVPTRSRSPLPSANADTHNYRFDPPQARTPQHPHDGDHEARVPRRPSPILPHSDPFAIPGASTMQSLGPIVRVVLLVALFTAAGVILLAGGKDQHPPAHQNVSTESAVTRQSLEPTDVVAQATTSVPTAAGPASVPDNSAEDTIAQTPAARELNGPPEVPATNDAHAHDSATESAGHPYPETAWPAAAMPEAGHTALPQVQTTDPPQAVAQLPGFITEIPQRHATHDDNQPGLH